jgi:hypothetical protein
MSSPKSADLSSKGMAAGKFDRNRKGEHSATIAGFPGLTREASDDLRKINLSARIWKR